ncbi:MAG TPA: hypothetical protein VNG33_09465 [Polyangiaceae bacterium]|nr:hypothetical protein [Polyangiaceae bacterium]
MQQKKYRSVLSLQMLPGLLGLASLVCVSLPARAEDGRPRDNYDDDRSSRRDSGSAGKTHIALDFDFGSALAEPETRDGGGGALRLGQKFDLFLVSFTPEIGGGYHAFGGTDQTKIYSGFIGGRFGVGKILEPSIFGHVGVARVHGFETRTAPLLDTGLALDFTLLPLIDLGVHGGYNVMLPRNDESALKFFTLGAQAALVL